MTTITREQLHERARRKVKELEFAITQSAFTSIRDGLEEELELARIALVSLVAEPVGEVSEKRHGLVMDGTVDLGGKSTYRIIKGEKAMKRLPLGTKFYIAPPAPVVDADPVVFTDERNLHHIARGRETSLIWGKQNQEVGDIPLYRHAQPVPVDKEFIPKNLDKALGVVGVALPESKEEFNFQIERWIQRLIDRVIRYADEFKEQPVPVVPDERAAFNAWNNEDNLPIAGVGAKNAAWLAWQARASLCGNSALNVPPERPADSSNGDDIEAWFDEGWNACRAAMLQGAEPVSQTYELPELIEGMEVSIDVSTCDADAGNRYFGTVTEISELYTAKNGYILLVQDAKPNFDVNGNSPVTPDGWISCSERMPNEEDVLVYCSDTKEQMVGFHKGKGLFQFFYMNGVEGVCEPSHWMPLPEPPQEEK
ncbi:DUF551 domain-containing protein [Salmonella enterica]